VSYLIGQSSHNPNNKAYDKSGAYSKSSKVTDAVIKAEFYTVRARPPDTWLGSKAIVTLPG
jgi:hypothetical protein